MEKEHNAPLMALIKLIDECGSQQLAAKRLGISPSYLSDILRNRRDFSEKVSKDLGFKRQIIYKKVNA